MSEKDNKEANILKDLKKVHETTLKDSQKSFDADKISSEEKEEQFKGSDADFDRSIGKEGDNVEPSKEQNKGSDADSDKNSS